MTNDELFDTYEKELDETRKLLRVVRVHNFVEDVCEWLESYYDKLTEADGGCSQGDG